MAKITDTLKNYLSPKSRKEELVAEHIIREHHKGRALKEILDDSYVTNHLSEDQIGRVLERQDVIHAVGEDTIAALKTPLAT
jgi:hypothetical protein